MEPAQVELLLIEDNQDEAELAIRNLRRHHLANRLVHIADGEEALDFIFSEGKYAHNKGKKFSPKLILLDLKLPKISGQEILRKIRADERTKLFPVVILTSSGEIPDIKSCYELGANSYIVKPVSFEGFSQAMANLDQYWMELNQVPEA